VIRIAVDAMGGDTAPQAEIAGALQALKSLPEGFLIQLVGRSDVINSELAKYPDADRSRLEIHEAAEVIGMAENSNRDLSRGKCGTGLPRFRARALRYIRSAKPGTGSPRSRPFCFSISIAEDMNSTDWIYR